MILQPRLLLSEERKPPRVRLATAWSSQALRTSKDGGLAAPLPPEQHRPLPKEEPLPSIYPELPCEKCSLRPLPSIHQD